MNCASIDIGTNTLRLLIAREEANGALKPLLYKRIITRLGGNYSEERGIDSQSAERTLKALEVFRKKLDEHGAMNVRAVATSVVRRAKNRQDFLKNAIRRAGIEIKIISGDEEARLSLLGVLSVVNGNEKKRLVMDIGGGSTEFILATGDKAQAAQSMEMGVVHLSEKYLKSDPPEKSELEAMEAEIQGVFSLLRKNFEEQGAGLDQYSEAQGAAFVGTAGTITTLAALDQNLEVYDRDRINNHVLTKASIKKMYEELSSLPLKDREKILSLEKGREDLIIAGAAITLKAMDEFRFESLKVSDAGLLEGVILDYLENKKIKLA